jgi:RNA polymerase subunit RPABC4/transcription elongation factor Spt4
MSKFREELRIIPTVARILAVLFYICLLTFISTVFLQVKPGPAEWPLAAKVAFAVFMPLPLVILVLVIGYIYADAKRRGMRPVLWTLLAVFVPNAIGIILYFVLRDPLLVACPNCATPVREGFSFCPKCGAATGPSCASCRRAVERGWTHCPYCGATLGGPA